jgi:hypothetical protein
MAAQSISTMVVAQNYAGEVVRQQNRTSALLRTIPITIGEGKNCAWTVESSGATAQEMAEGGDPTAPTSDAQAEAVLQWSYLEQSSKITGPAQAAARTSRTPQGNMNQVGRQVANSLASLMSKVNARCFSGSGAGSPKQVTGLDAAIGDTTNTYAAIVRGSSAYWQPYVVNPAVATNLSLGQIREDLKEIQVKCGVKPTLGFCHPGVLNEIINLFDSQRRHIQMVTDFTTTRGRIVLDASAAGVVVDGCVFLGDKDATLESGNGSGRIYYINPDFVDLNVLPQPEFRQAFPQLELEPEAMLTANDGFGEVPLMASVVKLAKTGDYTQYMAKVYCELRVRRPNACGVRRFVKLNYAA